MEQKEEWQRGHVKMRRICPDLFEMEVAHKKFHIIFEDMFYQINDITSGEVRTPSKQDEEAVRRLFWKFLDEFDIQL